MARHLGVERVLIVCPTSLKSQWSQEIHRFTGRKARIIEGLAPARAAAFREDDFFKITNYDTVHADLERIRAWAPDLVILDEAQRIKNWSTRTARSVKQIPSAYAIVLTGTGAAIVYACSVRFLASVEGRERPRHRLPRSRSRDRDARLRRPTPAQERSTFAASGAAGEAIPRGHDSAAEAWG